MCDSFRFLLHGINTFIDAATGCRVELICDIPTQAPRAAGVVYRCITEARVYLYQRIAAIYVCV